MRFRALRVSFVSGRLSFVVVDEEYDIHPEASAFLNLLTEGRGRSINTARAYGGRVAEFLSWADRAGVEWRSVSLTQMAHYRRWLEETEPGAHGDPRRGPVTNGAKRSGRTINGHLTAVSEFYRYCASQDLVEPRVASQLSEDRELRYAPRGYDYGENGEFRRVRAKVLKVRESEPAIELLTDDQVLALINLCAHQRDRFLIYGLRMTGLRIGEQLGLRRSDMHLLPTSQHLGCAFAGAHIHVVRREDNDNGALAKSRHRIVPVGREYVDYYRAYQAERSEVPEAQVRDLVFVNLFHEPLGRGMSYRSSKALFERLSRRAGFEARPHMLRHSFATRLLAQGVPIDVAKELLGHVSLSSTGVYLHPDAEALRQAVSGIFNLGGADHD